MKLFDVFDLEEKRLRPIVATAAGVRITSFTTATDTVVVDGAQTRDGKRVVTFLYKTADGNSGEVTLFVKRCVWKKRSETVHYRTLTDYGVPMPHLYGTLRDDDGNEVILLECLSAIGFDKNSDAEWRTLLSLMARFNSCPITAQYLPALFPYEQIGRLDEDLWISALDASPTAEEIVHNLRIGGVSDQDLPDLLLQAKALFARVAAQPKGLLHQDFLPDNFGWRGEREEMVVFDVPKNTLGPRFADVSPYLCLPDWRTTTRRFLNDAYGDTSRRDSLIRHYLDEYARFGGAMVSSAMFHKEATDLFWAHKVTILPRLVEQDRALHVREVLDALRQMPLSR